MSYCTQRAGTCLTCFDKTRGDAFVLTVSPGTVIEGVQLTLGILKDILDILGSIERKIAVGIDNESGREWIALNTYFFSGSSDYALPYEVKHGM